MMYRLLQLFATQPQLLADHAEGYAELLVTEIGHVSAAWKRRAVLNALALCCLGVAAVLAGVALMLWAVLPVAHLQALWVLIATPLLPIAAAVGCLVAARVKGDDSPFANVRQQMKADMAMLREMSAP